MKTTTMTTKRLNFILSKEEKENLFKTFNILNDIVKEMLENDAENIQSNSGAYFTLNEVCTIKDFLDLFTDSFDDLFSVVED